MEKFNYQPSGVCSRLFEFEVEDDKINNLNVIGGCHGNLQGISALLKECQLMRQSKNLKEFVVTINRLPAQIKLLRH